MASTGKANQSKENKASPRLSEQVHDQIMEYLRIAEKSKHPEIRKAALEHAKETSKYHRKQNTRVSPTLILWVNILLGFLLVGACWYAYLHYSEQKASQVRSISVLAYLMTVFVSLFLSGHLSQANFVKIMGWFKSGWKSVFGSDTTGD
jgi:hypothetical protein